MTFRRTRTRSDPCLRSQHQAQSLAQRRCLQRKQASYLAQVGAQREWKGGGEADVNGEGAETAAGAKAHTGEGGTGLQRPVLASSTTKDSEPLPAGQAQPAQASLSPGLYLPRIDFPACLLVVIKGCVPGVLLKRDWNLESWSN